MSVNSSTTTQAESSLEQLFRHIATDSPSPRIDLSPFISNAGTSDVVNQTRLRMAQFSQRITQSMNSTNTAMLEYARAQARAARTMHPDMTMVPTRRDNSTDPSNSNHSVFPSAVLGVVTATTTDATANEGVTGSISPVQSLSSSITLLARGRLSRGEVVNPSIHPQFRSKTVCKLFCKACGELMCRRGMKAILLGNAKVELFSTDVPPNGVQLNCECQIKDAACLGCGSAVGYHVTQPCGKCLESCNNGTGHFWMFHADSVICSERMDTNGTKLLRWSGLPCAEEDIEEVDLLKVSNHDVDHLKNTYKQMQINFNNSSMFERDKPRFENKKANCHPPKKRPKKY
ncbi:Protein fam72a [Nowakowskiella sp. JEL0078]|nr:Protein fam72a [Nowakowskiella sp. JEL0078]